MEFMSRTHVLTSPNITKLAQNPGVKVVKLSQIYALKPGETAVFATFHENFRSKLSPDSSVQEILPQESGKVKGFLKKNMNFLR